MAEENRKKKILRDKARKREILLKSGANMDSGQYRQPAKPTKTLEDRRKYGREAAKKLRDKNKADPNPAKHQRTLVRESATQERLAERKRTKKTWDTLPLMGASEI